MLKSSWKSGTSCQC